MFKIPNKDTGTTSIMSFIVDFEQVLHWFCVAVFDFEQVNTG